MKEEIIEIIKKIKPGVDIDADTPLISSEILSSMNILMLISNLEEKYDIEIGVERIRLQHFENVGAIEKLVQTIQDED